MPEDKVGVWLIVKLVVAVPEAGSDACAGLKLHVMPSGSPTQTKLTCPENELRDVTVSETAVDADPFGTVTLWAESASSMSGATGLMIKGEAADCEPVYKKVLVGVKTAVISWLPTPSVLTVMLALPFASRAAELRAPLLSWKFTVPAGIDPFAVTVACSVTFCPSVAAAGTFSVVVVVLAGA
jgi:hypothetical protein